MNDVIGKTPEGLEIRERQDYSLPGYCAECGHHVDPYDPALWSDPAETGAEKHVDGHANREDEKMAVNAETESMGSETLDDSPGGRFPRTRQDVKARIRWDGSCIYCGAAADRVGRISESQAG